MQKPFYTDGLKFSCQQCSHCCRSEPGYVYLSRSDLTNLSACFNLSDKVFVEKYCRWVPYYNGEEVLSLIEKPGYDCIFWDNGCTAYQARPIQCRTYPFWTYLLQDRKDWDQEAHNCPGINKGKLHDFNEIKSSMIQYEMNQPITKSRFYEVDV